MGKRKPKRYVVLIEDAGPELETLGNLGQTFSSVRLAEAAIFSHIGNDYDVYEDCLFYIVELDNPLAVQVTKTVRLV